MHEKFADVAVPALSDTEELLLTSSRIFPRHEAQPCGQIASLAELASITDGRKEGCSAQCPDAGDRHKPAGNIFSVRNRSNLFRQLVDTLLQPAQSANKSVRSQRIAGERSFDASSRTRGKSSLNRPAPCLNAMPYSRQKARIWLIRRVLVPTI